MITTVTTTTVTTIAQATSLALAGTVMLLIFLANKQLVVASANEKAQKIGKALNVVIVPLLFVFALTATIKLISAIG